MREKQRERDHEKVELLVWIFVGGMRLSDWLIWFTGFDY